MARYDMITWPLSRTRYCVEPARSCVGLSVDLFCRPDLLVACSARSVFFVCVFSVAVGSDIGIANEEAVM